jgi:hypothetical protein
VAHENLVLVAVWEVALSQDQLQGAGVVCYRKKNHVLVSLVFSCEYNLKVKLDLQLLWKVNVSFIFVYFVEKNGCMFIWQSPYINYGFQSLMPLIHSQRVQRPKAAIRLPLVNSLVSSYLTSQPLLIKRSTKEVQVEEHNTQAFSL